jgi:alkaline phosphatase D
MRPLTRLVTGALLVAGLLIAVSAQTGAQAPFPDGIAIGDVTQDAAIFWTRLVGSGDVRAEYSTEPGFTSARAAGPVRAGAESDFTVRLDLRNLQPGQRYHVRALSRGLVGPSAAFVTPPAPEQDAPLSLIWGADTYENYQPFRVFEAMRSRSADLFLYLGDTIYADLGPVRATTLDEYRQKYRRNRQDTALRAYLASTATWVVWDDHEVENNFSSNHPRLTVGLRALLEHWPIRTTAAQPTRLYRSLRWGRTAEIFILDTRQYRSPSAARDGPAKTMLGPAQKRWLLDGLQRSDAAIKIIASTVALRYSGRDSWGGYARERNEILGLIRDQRIQNVIVLVADVHYAALIRHPEGLHEAIAGPLAAFPAGAAHAAGRPGTLWAEAGRSNYGWLRIAFGEITVGWWDDQNAFMFQTRIPLQR